MPPYRKTAADVVDYISADKAYELECIWDLVKNKTNHDFSLYKPNTILRRVSKRLSKLHLSTVSDYIYYLQHHPAEINILFKEILIKATSFFRDADGFEQLKKTLLEHLTKAKPNEKYFRVWVPGCSTGEEVYSIAIILQECMDLLNINLKIQIFGTDLDEKAIATARLGLFKETIEKEISAERLNRFFKKEGSFYKIDRTIRKMIIFAVQNLIQDPPFIKLNLISCRNLLIYFNTSLQKNILASFSHILCVDGIMFLGPTENIGNASNLFHESNIKWRIYRRKQTDYLIKQTKSPHITIAPIRANIMKKNETSLSDLVKNTLLDNYVPASIVIDDKDRIIHVYGHTRKFLEFPSGTVQLSLMSFIRAELKPTLHSAILKASSQQKEIMLTDLQFSDEGHTTHLNIKIKPIINSDLNEKLLLIIFEEITSLEEYPPQDSNLKIKDNHPKRVINLKEKLITLETKIAAYETTNEVLQLCNEELQSINEEIETSREELTSLNEELTSVNFELGGRVEELSSANHDIVNLLDNTEIATIFLYKNLCIKRFTKKTTELINVIASDIGRPINHIVFNLPYNNLTENIKYVLTTLEPMKTECMDTNGHWHCVQITPSRTVTNQVSGVTISFINIDAQKKAENSVLALEKELLDLKNSLTERL